jgi:hypothetical protein
MSQKGRAFWSGGLASRLATQPPDRGTDEQMETDKTAHRVARETEYQRRTIVIGIVFVTARYTEPERLAWFHADLMKNLPDF